VEESVRTTEDRDKWRKYVHGGFLLYVYRSCRPANSVKALRVIVTDRVSREGKAVGTGSVCPLIVSRRQNTCSI